MSEFLADFHVHSTFSDGRLSIPELVDLYGGHGFGALAITDHLCEGGGVFGRGADVLGRTLTAATLGLYQSILESEKQRAWEQYGLILFSGIEVTKNSFSNHRSAHFLGVFSGAPDLTTLNPAEDVVVTAGRIRDQGGITVAAHPVSTRKIEKQTRYLWDRREDLRNIFDAWEVASGPHLFPEVLREGLPLLASSDLHHPKQIRSFKTKMRCERSPMAILEAIRNQEVEFAFFEPRK